MASLYRPALLIESAANFVGGLPLIIFPERTLTLLMKSSQITPGAANLGRVLGCIFCGLSTPLLMSYPDTPSAIAARRITYYTLAVPELLLIGLSIQQLLDGSTDYGFKPEALLGMAANLGAFVCMRAYFMFVVPHSMEGTARAKKLQ